MMAAHVGGQSNNDDNAKPASDGRMGLNARNPALTKAAKKEKECYQTLSVGNVTLRSNI